MKRRRQATLGDPQRAVIYLRVSTNLAAQDAGLVSQQAACEAWAKLHGVTIAGQFQDRISGVTEPDRRPGLMDALLALERERAGVLLVAHRSRIARDVVVTVCIERLARDAGAQVVSADGVTTEQTPEGQLVRAIIDAFSQYERMRLVVRMRAAVLKTQARKREAGEYAGGALPIGWRLVDGRVVEDQDEQATVHAIVEASNRGHGVAAIARELTRMNVPCRGKDWHRRTVLRVLKRARRTT